MCTAERVKYVQRGPDQVLYYVVGDPQSGSWAIEVFVDGPDGVQCIGTREPRDVAVSRVQEVDMAGTACVAPENGNVSPKQRQEELTFIRSNSSVARLRLRSIMSQ